MYAKSALTFANRVITRLGGVEQTDLLPGSRTNPWSCPIANTIKAGLPGAAVCVDEKETTVIVAGTSWEEEFETERGAVRFIASFDAGRQPQYETTEEEAA
jgi:hypothetical protein